MHMLHINFSCLKALPFAWKPYWLCSIWTLWGREKEENDEECVDGGWADWLVIHSLWCYRFGMKWWFRLVGFLISPPTPLFLGFFFIFFFFSQPRNLSFLCILSCFVWTLTWKIEQTEQVSCWWLSVNWMVIHAIWLRDSNRGRCLSFLETWAK